MTTMAHTTRHAAPPRSLAPREHGAYGQLVVPLVTALVMGRLTAMESQAAPSPGAPSGHPGVAAALLSIASVAAFLAHEPLLVLLGQRGPRARRTGSSRALRVLAGLGAALLLAGGAGFALAPPVARVAVTVPLALAAIVALLIAREQEKTAAGEMVAAAALSSAALPVALASGVAPACAWGAWGAWTLAFAAATWAVRATIAHNKGGSSFAGRALPLLVPAGIAALLAALGARLVVASLPVFLFALAVTGAPPHPRELRRVGWGLVASTVITATLLIVGCRL